MSDTPQDFWRIFDEAESSGATILCAAEDRGTNLAARLIALPNHHFDIAKEEIFGPALVLIPYSDFSDAESIIFDLKSTLQGAVFTDDDSLWERAQRTFSNGCPFEKSATDLSRRRNAVWRCSALRDWT